jgi:site-specific recombinase XerD
MNKTPLPSSFHDSIERFLRAQEGRNRSTQTIRAYRSDLSQMVRWLHEDNSFLTDPVDVTTDDLNELLAHLASIGITGVSRARKLAAIREYFRYLKVTEVIDRSPVDGVETPRRERTQRNYLNPEEYNRLLAAAGAHPRDFCILTLFLQTGIRISELCELRLDDIELDASLLHVRVGKGMAARSIELEKKAIRALKTWLESRPTTFDDHLFVHKDGVQLKEWGVRDLLEKYRVQAGVTKKISPHSLRHTFASFKAQQGVSPFQLKDWLGHARLDTTAIYVHMARQNAKKIMEATSL